MYKICCAIQTTDSKAYHENYVKTMEEALDKIKIYIISYRIRAGDMPDFLEQIPNIQNHQSLRLQTENAFLRVERNDNIWILNLKQ